MDTGENISISHQAISLGLETGMRKFPFTLLRHAGYEAEFTNKASATAEKGENFRKCIQLLTAAQQRITTKACRACDRDTGS